MDKYKVTFRKPKEFQEEFLDSAPRDIYVEAPGIIPAIDKAIDEHAKEFPGRSLGYVIIKVELIPEEGEF